MTTPLGHAPLAFALAAVDGRSVLAGASTLAGFLLVLVTLWDIVLAILHLDKPAPLERMVQRAVWRTLRPLVLRGERPSRSWLAAAGPVMVLSILFVWNGFLILGFALVQWPILPGQYATDGAVGNGFLDAVYYSGVTLTTLGYGDVTPLTAYAKVIAIAEAITGFLVLAGVLAYLVTTIEGITRRNALALRVHAETGRTGDGVRIVTRSLAEDDADGLRVRLDAMADAMRGLEERFHGYPLLAFYYRARDADHDPEPMFRAIAEAALAGRLLPSEGPARRLRPVVEDLDHAVTHFMIVTAEQYMDAGTVRALEAPSPDDLDAEALEHVRARIDRELPEEYRPANPHADLPALRLAHRSRVFLDALDGLTSWKAFHPSTARRVGSDA